MSTEAKNVLATAFVVVALIAALASATVVAIAAANLSKQIQAQRHENITRVCQEQNQRNRKAYVFLQALPVNPNGPKLSPVARAKLVHGFTDAIVGPVHSDCSTYADSVVSP